MKKHSLISAQQIIFNYQFFFRQNGGLFFMQHSEPISQELFGNNPPKIWFWTFQTLGKMVVRIKSDLQYLYFSIKWSKIGFLSQCAMADWTAGPISKLFWLVTTLGSGMVLGQKSFWSDQKKKFFFFGEKIFFRKFFDFSKIFQFFQKFQNFQKNFHVKIFVWKKNLGKANVQ